MLNDVLFPDETSLQLDEMEVVGNTLILVVSSQERKAMCPTCQTYSQRAHSCYRRQPADLPIAEQAVQLEMVVQRFFCDNPRCKATTFAHRLPEFIEPHARRTNRLKRQQQQVAFDVNAKTGERLLDTMRMTTSHDTLLRLVRTAPEPEASPLRVVGIDDWARCKGQTYGTILVDLERHAVVDVLDERSAESTAAWFRAHPGIEVISRDRGNEYRQGATQGAPEATQVADRWHLLKNLREALERLLEQKPQVLKAAASKPAPTEGTDQAPVADEAPVAQSQTDHPPEAVSSDEVVSTRPLQEELQRQARHARRLAHYQRVKELAAEGLSYCEIGRQTGLDRRTVKKYHLSPACPVIPARGNSVSKVAVYGDYVAHRVSEGCETIAVVWCELRDLGFDGSYSSVRRWMNRAHPSFASSNRQPALKAVIPWSVCRGSWLLTKPEETLSEEEKQAVERMQQSDAQIGAAHRLAQRFIDMFSQRKPDALDSWLEDATQSGVKVLKGFAQSLRGDMDAVRNALRLPWSQGQVEGQVNRLKMIKRSMYGRAHVDLLRKKVMGCSLVT